MGKVHDHVGQVLRVETAWVGIGAVVALMMAGCTGPAAGPGPVAEPEVADRLAFDDVQAREFDLVQSPLDPDHLTMGFMIPKENFYWAAIGHSTDGGASWDVRRFCGDPEHQAPTPDAAGCHFAGAVGVADPVLQALPDGTVVYAGVIVHGYDIEAFAARFPPGAFEPESVVTVARSAFDQFAGAHMVPAPLYAYYNGKANLHFDGERLHMVWAVDLRYEDSGQPNRAIPVWAYSDDEGRTWSAPRHVSGSAFGDLDAPFAVGADIIETHDGSLHILWWDGASNKLYQVSSADRGDRWTTPREVADIQGRPEGGPVDFQNVTRIWADVDADGAAYVVYDEIVDGDRDVMLLRSTSHALTWQQPVRVSHLEGADGQDETLPRMLVHNGTIDVLYVTYDAQWRSSGHHMHLARSRDGGATWSHLQLTGEGSPLTNVGDYNALAPTRDGVLAVWEDGRGGPADAHWAWQAHVPTEWAPLPMAL